MTMWGPLQVCCRPLSCPFPTEHLARLSSTRTVVSLCADSLAALVCARTRHNATPRSHELTHRGASHGWTDFLPSQLARLLRRFGRFRSARLLPDSSAL